jgi:hypothetical protein
MDPHPLRVVSLMTKTTGANCWQGHWAVEDKPSYEQ